MNLQPAGLSSQELRAAVSEDSVRQFYEARNWRPAWNDDQARELTDLLGEARRHGLHRSMFLPDGDLSGNAARGEAALTRAALAYARALAQGHVDPNELHGIYTLPRPDVAIASGLAAALDAGNLRDWFAGLAPQDSRYRTLSAAYLDAVRAAGGDRQDAIESGGLIREGDSDPRVARIAARLQERGVLDADPATFGTRYDSRLAEAVERLQRQAGIAVDGVLGPDTFAVLNRGPADRARQLAVNLERRRWLQRDPPSTRIDVNVAATELQFWRDGQVVDRRAVIAGQPGWETPQLRSPIYRLVANPTWTVPKSIERREMASVGPAYLRRNNMERRNGWIVQLPGPDNALGQVKFDMQNDHAIYLHDTPAKHLFDANERHRSHGCVRVEDALGFARMIAEQEGVLPQFEEALASGEETFVSLPRHIPVRLLYHSAFVGPAGEIELRPDSYGWDEDVAEAMGLPARPRPAPNVHVDDGPTP